MPYSRALLLRYREINQVLWARFRRGEVSTDDLARVRFCELLHALGRDAAGGEALGRAYLDALSSVPHLQPGTRRALAWVQARFRTAVVTNGIERVQQARIAAAGLSSVFDVIVTSEGCGFRKPDARIVHEALRALNAQPDEAILVGDDAAADGGAARAAGVAFCWVPLPDAIPTEHPPDHRIASLRELPALLRRLAPERKARAARI